MSGNTKSGSKSNKKAQQYEFKKRMPTGFGKFEKEYWNHNLPILKERKLIADSDYHAFTRACLIYSKIKECEKALKSGLSAKVTGDKGQVRLVRRPEADLLLKFSSELSRLERYFGLTPASRKSLRITSGSENINSIRNKFRQ